MTVRKLKDYLKGLLVVFLFALLYVGVIVSAVYFVR
jgi:hypothetical protein